MSVNVSHCVEGLVTERSGERYNVHAWIDQSRIGKMSKLTDTIKWIIVPLPETLQSSVGCVRVPGFSVAANENAVCIRPVVARLGAFRRALDLQLAFKVYYLLRELQSPLWESDLGGICVNALANSVTGSYANADDVILPDKYSTKRISEPMADKIGNWDLQSPYLRIFRQILNFLDIF